MILRTHLSAATFATVCAISVAACQGGAQPLTAPSAVAGSSTAAANPDGSTMKYGSPVAVFPLNEASGVRVTPMLSAQPAVGRFENVILPHRFQLSTTETFDAILQTGFGTVDAQGILRFEVATALDAAARIFWRLRVEQDDQFGPWSNTLVFTVTGTVVPPPQPVDPNAKRTPNPAAGQRLPLPNLHGELSKFNNTSDSCPTGRQYENNPWLDRVIDHFRTLDTRWGYNKKPTRTAADNKGSPVISAGDEVAYNWGSQNDEGTFEVYLVDILVSHCGTPSTGWRVITEESGIWTGLGRF